MSADSSHSSPDPLVKRLFKKIGSLACPVCKHDTLTSLSNGEGIGTKIEMYQFDDRSPPRPLLDRRTLTVACMNCGYIRQFMAEFLTDEDGAPKSQMCCRSSLHLLEMCRVGQVVAPEVRIWKIEFQN